MNSRNRHILFVLALAIGFIVPAQQSNIDSLKSVLKNAKHDTIRCKALNALVENEPDEKVWVKYNDELLSLAEKAKQTAKTTTEKNIYNNYIANVYNNRGILAQQSGNTDEALLHFNKSLELQKSLGPSSDLAAIITNIGYVYNSRGEISKALKYWQDAIKIQEKIGDKKGMAYALNNMGSVYNHQGDVPKALECLHRSLKIQESIGEKKGMSNSLNNIAGIYGAQGEREKALEYYNKSLAIRIEIDDKKGIGTSYNNIGFTYNNLGQNEKALEYYFKSLKIREEAGDKAGYANSLNNIASNLSKQGKEDTAIVCFLKSLSIQEQIQHKEGVSISTSRLAESYLKKGNLKEAFKYASRSLAIAKELGFPENINDAASVLKNIYLKQNKYKEAFEMQELEIQMRDSISNSETKKEAVRKLFQYQYEKKAAQDSIINVEEHKVKNTKLALHEAQLQKEKIQRFALYGGLLLIAGFGIFAFNRFRVVNKQKEIIERQKLIVDQEKEVADSRRIIAEEQREIIKEKQKEIIDSLHYASRIQRAILTSEKYIETHFKGDFFVYYQPKDIVSGDFYWAVYHHNRFYIATADCTGHGVPGAFMSLLNVSYLNENVIEKKLIHTDEILNEQREQIIKALNPNGDENSRDGMDCSLCAFDFENSVLEYSCANNSIWIVRDGELTEHNGDKMAVGMYDNLKTSFQRKSIQLQKGDIVYTFTDGFADQFGGEKGKKLMYKNFAKIILQNSQMQMKEQKELLKNAMDEWKGSYDQIDDILVIGLKIA